MSKNTYSIVEVNTNTNLYDGTSFSRAYSFALDYFIQEENLGKIVKMVKNLGKEDEQELIRYISARATSGIIHTYDLKKWEGLQVRHQEALKRAEEEKKALEARKEARKAAKEAMKLANQKPQEEAKVEEQVVEEKVAATKGKTSNKQAKAKK